MLVWIVTDMTKTLWFLTIQACVVEDKGSAETMIVCSEITKAYFSCRFEALTYECSGKFFGENGDVRQQWEVLYAWYSTYHSSIVGTPYRA